MANLPTRNNNPGDLKNTQTGMFNKYNSPQEGFNALEGDLNLKINGQSKTGLTPDSTIDDFASKWAPSSDNNDPKSYAKNLAKKLGISTYTPISALKDRVHDFANAIADNEGYQGNRVSGTSQTVSPETPIAGKLSQDDFAQKIKEKYPAYANLDNATLTQKILQKYPQYADKVDVVPQPIQPSPSSAPSHVAPTSTSAGIDTSHSGILGKIGGGIVNFLTGAEQAVGNDLTAGARARMESENENTLRESQFQTEKTLKDLIAQRKAQGLDTSHQEKVLAGIKANDITPQEGDFASAVPESTKSNAQGLLDVAGVGADVLPFGTYGKATKLMKAGELARPLSEAPSAVKVIKNVARSFSDLEAPVVKNTVKSAGLDMETFRGLKPSEKFNLLDQNLSSLSKGDQIKVQKILTSLKPLVEKEDTPLAKTILKGFGKTGKFLGKGLLNTAKYGGLIELGLHAKDIQKALGLDNLSGTQ